MVKNKKPHYMPRTINQKQFASLSKEALSKPNAPHLKVKGYVLTSHAQNRMVEHNIPAVDVVRTLKKIERTAPYNKKNNSYEKHGKRVTICVAADTNVVKTLHELDHRDAKKYHIKWEPMSNYRKNDPHVIEYQKKSKPKNTSNNQKSRTTNKNKPSKIRR